MRRPPRILAVLLAFVMAAACTGDDDSAADRDKGKPAREVALRLASSLKPFDACDDLLDHVQDQAVAHAGSYSIFGGGMRGDVLVAGREMAAPTADAATSTGDAAGDSTNGAQSQGDFSGTNVQEEGVDEPDTVKTDGRRLFTIARGRLQALEVTGGDPRLAGSLDLPPESAGSAQLLLAGDHLLVLSTGWAPAPAPPGGAPAQRGVSSDMMVMPGKEQTVLRLVDVADPVRLRVISTLEVDGRVVGARMVGTTIRLVTTASPGGFAPVFPQGPSAKEQSSARDATVRQVKQSTVDNWLPSFRLVKENASADAPAVTSGLLVPCDRVSRPAEFSGLGTISVLTFDLSADDLGDGDATSVLADGQTVYASAASLYVATTRYDEAQASGSAAIGPAGPDVATEIHKFDITGAGPARHSASGRVKGQILNQFSFSEHDGFLRVATTQGSGGDGSESFVTVLAERDGRLTATGTVGNLGRGERIYAVRFMGDVGYVVTFRQTDPLYTIDLSDPTRPLVVGELKIPGFSAYLHPVGEGLLLGIGQDATDTGQRLGAQVSLFDVSDPARPQRLDQATLGSGASAVEYDHHAFLWWGPRRLAVVPVQNWDGPAPFNGVVGFRADRETGIDEIGRVRHEPDRTQGKSNAVAPPEILASPIQRSLVIGEALYTLSDTGVLASDIGDLAPLEWVAFPA